MSNESTSAGSGIGLGAVIAVAMSWSANHSIGWAIVHGFFGWLYVITKLMGCDGG